jgi:hypothetical protein
MMIVVGLFKRRTLGFKKARMVYLNSSAVTLAFSFGQTNGCFQVSHSLSESFAEVFSQAPLTLTQAL